MVRGTPTWSIDKLGSGVMTARAEKSTRFPIKFPLIRPSLLFSLCFTDFKGRPDFCMACGKMRENVFVVSFPSLYLDTLQSNSQNLKVLCKLQFVNLLKLYCTLKGESF